MKSQNNEPSFKPRFNILLQPKSMHCRCQKIRSVFRVLGIYNFATYLNICVQNTFCLYLEIGGIQTIQFNQIVFKPENRADVFQLSTFNYFPINLGSTREQGPYLTSNFRLAGLLTMGIFLSNSLIFENL